MSTAAYVTTLDLAAGALLLTAVLVVWRSDLGALIKLLAWQGVALAAIPMSGGLYHRDAQLIAVGTAVLVLRAGVFPWLLRRLLRAAGEVRESDPLLTTSVSLLVVAVLAGLSYAVSRPLVALDPSPALRASPVALTVVLVALFVLVTRRHALSQVAGILMLDNGIAALAFLATGGVPLIVELGVSIDVLLAILVFQVLVARMQVKFGSVDVGELRELHE